ncbi:hypothetical protein FRC19_010163 [Serendipita sp. 401]|nr:hypothetical protein FRC19_010163 [Serendipita sp. 401]
MRLTTTALFVLFALSAVTASSGDRDSAFQWCVATKSAQQCHNPAETLSSSSPKWRTMSLWLTRWTCEDDCRYQCTHVMTDKARAADRPVEQFYGKWAFWRFWGMQEPASVFFSLLNLWAHIWCGFRLRKVMPRRHPMRPFYLLFTLSNVNLWIWSAVFHTRDNPVTEKLDYFSAAFAMFCGLYYSVVRLYHLYDTPQTRHRHRVLRLWALLCFAAFVAHVAYLTLLPRFDYGWNMKVNVTVGLAYNLLWISYSLLNPPYTRFYGISNDHRPRFVLTPLFLGLAMISAVSLEIFDFPPWWRVIDAHSLWHLATVPIIIGWYQFLRFDSLDPSWKEEKSTA